MKKRFLGILLALCMILTLVPATAFAADTAVTVTDAAELAAAVAAGGTVKLGDDIDITSTLEINGTVTLDLNGRVLKMTGSGSVIAITSSGDLTLTDGNSAATHTDTSLPVGGVITGGNDTYGGGVYVGSEGKFTMEGGTISNCTAYGGGGVANLGEFTMEGGSISGCTSRTAGGGVYNRGNFTMEGGSISNCKADLGGGVCNAGTFTMEGGTISNCRASNSGGGVRINDGNFTMEGGSISNCTATNNGGGVCNSGGNFTMEGGSISGCTATTGGGVCNDTGNFTMEGGTISNCRASNSGGGVRINDGNFTMEGGSISNCTATKNGGGVRNSGGNFTMEGGSISGCTATTGGGVFNEMNGTLKNTSTTGGATICYGELSNDGSIEGKLVKFYNGDDLYAWEIVPENAKAVKPADPQKSGYVLDWYTEEACLNKWDFDTDTVSADMQLYANRDPIITLTVPFTTTVALGDVGKPGETVFDLAIVQTSMPEEYDTRVTVSGTLTTNGEGSYDGKLTLTGPSEELRAMLCEGAIVQQVNGGEANWTYDDTVWGLLLYNGAMYADLNDDQEQAPAMQISIYPATCENTDDGPYYKLDWEAVYACQTVDEMTFTNTYTAHEYALNHDADGHWDECPCGDVQNKEAHKFGEWKVTKDATASAKGEKERVCSVCDYVETAEIPMPEENEPPKTDVPQTGDDRNMALWFTLLFVSGGALIGTAVYDKKRKYSAK